MITRTKRQSRTTAYSIETTAPALTPAPVALSVSKRTRAPGQSPAPIETAVEPVPITPETASDPDPAFPSSVTARAGTKQALVVDLLTRADGASLAELVAATGWLTHTTRAALTGLRKRGHAIIGNKVDKTTRYRIAGAEAR